MLWKHPVGYGEPLNPNQYLGLGNLEEDVCLDSVLMGAARKAHFDAFLLLGIGTKRKNQLNLII